MSNHFLQPYLFQHQRPILVIDDSSMYRSGARGMLQKLGFRPANIHLAQNAKDAKLLCAENDYAIIFYDYNLGSENNGFYLMEELLADKLISSSCVNIIVTAEGSADVVRSFMELGPDGYLLKPISHDILKVKLPLFVNTKAALQPIYRALDDENYDKVLRLTEEVIDSDEAVLIKTQTLKAQAQIELNMLHEARNTTVSLQQLTHQSAPYFMQVDIALRQRQFKQAQFTLDHMPSSSVSLPQILDRKATVQIMQSRLEIALEYQQKALALSSMPIERHWRSALLHAALAKFTEGVAICEHITNKCQYTRFNHVDTYHLGAQLLLDDCQFSGQEIKSTEQVKLRFFLDAMKKRCKQSAYEITESLLLARYQLLSGNRKLFLAAFNSVQQKIKGRSLTELGAFNCIELLKIATLTHNERQVNQTHEQLRSDLKVMDAIDSKLIQAYLAHWRSQTQQCYSQCEALRKDADTLLKSGKNERAIELLFQGFELNKVDINTPRLFLFALTKSIPEKMARTDAINLVYRCIRRLASTPYIASVEFKTVCKQLEKNLNVNDFSRVL